MLRQIEGSKAVAEVVALCHPEVICAYPISPQTHIIEALGAKVKGGELTRCEMLNVESELAAMSVLIGASAAGARTYTATASQGLLFMVEAVYNAAGLGLPVVMTLANRAVGAPINIWNDHSDAMAARDSGWVQLFAETNQDAADLHLLAFRLAEEVSLPVMVCMDGYVLTHAFERVDLPSLEQVGAFLPAYVPRQVLDPEDPVSIGAMVGPEAFEEVRYLAHVRHLQALEQITEVARELGDLLGRPAGGLISEYRLDGAETVVIAMGSVLGTIKDTVDALRDAGAPIGVVGVTSFRPFPAEAIRAAAQEARRVVVVEKAFSIGFGGVLSTDVAMALTGSSARVRTVVAGLGGRPITQRSLAQVLQAGHLDALESVTFLDLKQDLIDRELARMGETRRSGPMAENVLRDVGRVGSGVLW